MLNSPHNKGNAHHNIARHLDAAGIEPPAGIIRAVDIDLALGVTSTIEVLTELRAGINGTMTPAKCAAALKVAAADLLAQERASQLRNDVQPDLDSIARRALHADADRILTDLRPKFAEAVAQVRAVVDMFGTLNPPSDIRNAPGLVDLVNRSTSAQEYLRHVRTVRLDLADVGYGPATEDPTWWIVNTHDLDNAPARLVDIIAAGIDVRPNTLPEMEQLTAARLAEQERLAVKRAEKKKRDADADPMVRSIRAYRDSLRTPEPQDAA